MVRPRFSFVTAVVTVAILLAASLTPIPAAGETLVVSVVINGQVLRSDPPAFIQDGRTLVPMRAVLEALGASLDWDGDTRTATASYSQHRVQVTIGERVAYRNGQAVMLDVPAQIVQDRTFLPLRFTAESLGAEVKWDGASRTARIWGSGSSHFHSPESVLPISSLLNPVVIGEHRLWGDPWGVRDRMTAAKVTTNASPMEPGIHHCEFGFPVPGYMNCLVRWEGDTATIDWEQALRGMVRHDNTGSVKEITIKYTQSKSETHSTTTTGSLSVGAEGSIKTPIWKFAEAKLTGQVTVSKSGTWSWTAGESIEVPLPIPPGKVGYIYSYNAGVVIGGRAYYELWQIDASGAEHYLYTHAEPVGAKVPTAGNYNFKTVHADS